MVYEEDQQPVGFVPMGCNPCGGFSGGGGGGGGPPCGGMQMPGPGFQQGGTMCQGPAPGAPYESFPIGQEAIFEFVGALRRQVATIGFEAALSNCQSEGSFLAGFAVYCFPANDRRQLQMLIEAAGGQWLESAPDSSFSQAVPTMVFCQMPDLQQQQPQQWQGYGGGYGDQWGGGGGGGWGRQSGGGWGGQSGQKSWSSTSPYVDSYLQPADNDNYMAAGLLLWRRGEAGVELLLPLERPWNSFTNDYDPLAWNVLGAKKSGWEHSPRETAVRCILEILGGIELAPKERDLQQMCKRSVAVWYPRGKFALFLHEVKGDASAAWENPGLSERFKEAKGRPRSDQYAQQVKFMKEIEDFEWVPGKDLVAAVTRQPLTDLLAGFTRIGGFQAFLNHGSLPLVLEDYSSWAAEDRRAGGRGGAQRQGGGGGGWGAQADGGKGRGGRGGWDRGGYAGEPWQGGGGGGGWGQGDPTGGWAQADPTGGWGKGKGDFSAGKGDGKGQAAWQAGPPKGVEGPPKGAAAPKGPDSGKGAGGRGGGKDGKGDQGAAKGKAPPASAAAPAQEAAVPPEETAKQSIGEQLYVLVQNIVRDAPAKQVPAFLVAQKITGMLLELPEPELLALLDTGPAGRSELEERVGEATEILEEQGFV